MKCPVTGSECSSGNCEAYGCQIKTVRQHVCLLPEHHTDFLDSFIYTDITEEAKQALDSNAVEYDGQTIHFPKGHIHPEHSRMMVMYPNENDVIICARTWTMPDGTVIRHNTKENVVDIVREESWL